MTYLWEKMTKQIIYTILSFINNYDQYSHLLNDMKMSICLKRKIMNGVILPAMTYGSESWSLTTLTNKQRDRIAVAQGNIERLIFGVTRKDKKQNEWIREETEVYDIVENIDAMKWSWTGLPRRMKNDR